MYNTHINLIFAYMLFIVAMKSIKNLVCLLKRYASIVTNTNKMKSQTKISGKLTKKTNRFYHNYSHFLSEKNHVRTHSFY